MEIDPKLLYLLLYELQKAKKKNRQEIKKEFMETYGITADEFDKIESYGPHAEYEEDYDDEYDCDDGDIDNDFDNDFDGDFGGDDFEADVGLDYGDL